MDKIKIKIESVNNKILKLYVRFLLKLLSSVNTAAKTINLPTLKKRVTFLKSPHVFKKAKEHFELRKNSVVLFCNSNLQNLKLFLINRPNTIKIKISYQKRR